MAKSCPISSRQINESLVRVFSLEVSFIVILLIATNLSIFAYLLLYDFSIRAFRLQKYSPVFVVAQFVVKIFNIKPKFSDEAPKRFALFIGLIFSILLSILYTLGYYEIGFVVSIILLVCALLEGLFQYCVGCKLYQILTSISQTIHFGK